jgi:enamine deaminase RidA (YjgF/YER057c/UK114 family)
LDELGIALPPPFPPAGNYLACVVDGDLVHVGGHGPIAGDDMVCGKVGTDLTLEQAQRAARMTALSILATVAAELGDLDRIERIVKVFGMVNCAPGFNQTPAPIDGVRAC